MYDAGDTNNYCLRLHSASILRLTGCVVRNSTFLAPAEIGFIDCSAHLNRASVIMPDDKNDGFGAAMLDMAAIDFTGGNSGSSSEDQAIGKYIPFAIAISLTGQSVVIGQATDRPAGIDDKSKEIIKQLTKTIDEAKNFGVDIQNKTHVFLNDQEIQLTRTTPSLSASSTWKYFTPDLPTNTSMGWRQGNS